MKLKNIYTSMLLLSISSSTLLAAPSLNVQNKQSQTKQVQNQNQELSVNKSAEDDPSGLGPNFTNTDIVQGNLDLGDTDEITTINYIAGQIKDDDIISVKKTKEKLAKVSNSNVEDVILKSDTIYYNPEEGLESTVYLKYGYSTDIEFVDELGNPINVKGMSVGNRIFNASIPEPNMISLLATSKYKETNFNIRLDGQKDPVILRVKEGSNNVSNTRVKVVLSSSKKQDESDEMNLKTNILTELLKYGTLHGTSQLDYEVVDIARKETSYFEKKYLKIFKVEKNNKTFTIVLLDNMYEILGMNKNAFNKYQNSFNVYFIPQNKEIFTIMTKYNDSKDHLSLGHQKDAGLIEKYRILINN